MVRRIIIMLFIMLIFVSAAWAGELRQVNEAPVGKCFFDGTYSNGSNDKELVLDILFVPTIKSDGKPDHTIFTYSVNLDKGICICTVRKDYDSNNQLYKEHHYERLISVPVEKVDSIVNALQIIKNGNDLIAKVVVVGDSNEKFPEAIEVNTGDYFKVVLHAAGGTGYGWALDSESLKLIELVSSNVAQVNSQSLLVGGKAIWEFYLRLKPEMTGQETIHFYLSRPWEKNEKPAQVFDLTVVAK